MPALLDGYCTGWPPARKAAYVAQQLSLQGSLDPARCAHHTAMCLCQGVVCRSVRHLPHPGLRQPRMLRRVYLGGALTAGEPGGRAWWVPHELLEHLQAAYCSTLAVELDHLTSLCGPLECPEGAGMCEEEVPAVGLRTSVLMSLLPQDDQAGPGP